MKHKIFLILITLFLLMSCVGCGTQTQQEDMPTESSAQANSELPDEDRPSDAPNANPQNGDELFEICNLNGTVTEFFDNGCKVIPIINEGNVAYQAAPGYEDQQEQITVSYVEGCTFQIAYANLQTGKITCDDANMDDIKKQTELVICGEYDSDNTLLANRVFIYRVEE